MHWGWNFILWWSLEDFMEAGLHHLLLMKHMVVQVSLPHNVMRSEMPCPTSGGYGFIHLVSNNFGLCKFAVGHTATFIVPLGRVQDIFIQLKVNHNINYGSVMDRRNSENSYVLDWLVNILYSYCIEFMRYLPCDTSEQHNVRNMFIIVYSTLILHFPSEVQSLR